MNISSFNLTGKVNTVYKITFGAAGKQTKIGQDREDKFTSRNLYHFLDKRIRTTEEVVEFLEKNDLSEDETYIGELPDAWREKFKPEETGESTLKIQKMFADFACRANTQKFSDFNDLLQNEKIQSAVKRLETDLSKRLKEKYFVIPEGQGAFGKVFKIISESEAEKDEKGEASTSYALKIYHSNYEKHYALQMHGPTKEIANAVALNDELKPSQRARFYCGKVTDCTKKGGDKGAFMLTEFVKKPAEDEKSKAKAKLLSDENDGTLSTKKIKTADARNCGNLIDGKITDFGGIYASFKSVREQQTAKKLYTAINNSDIDTFKALKQEYENDDVFKSLLDAIVYNIEFKLEEFDGHCSIVKEIQRGLYTKETLELFEEAGVCMDSENEEVKKEYSKIGFIPKKAESQTDKS